MEETGGRTARGRTAGGRTRLAYGDAENRRTAFSSLHYYMQDELGSPLRVSGYRKKEGSFIGRSEYLTYGYDEFGNDLGDDLRRELEGVGIPDPYDRQGVEQPFGYTGYWYDDISETYFAQAREYGVENGRFVNKDKEKYVLLGDISSCNLYLYCKNSPLIYLDNFGNEIVIVTGGIDDEAPFDYTFVEPALKGVNDFIDEGVPNEDITWMVINAGYTSDQMDNFNDTADNLGVNFVAVDNKEEFVTYINEKDGGISRAEDQIVGMMFFCHGQCPRYSGSSENQLSFAYHIEDIDDEKRSNIDFTQSDISRLDEDAFNEALTIFFSCNAGTKDSDGKSFAQEWSNKTGGMSYGIKNGRTYYGAINMTGSFGFYLSNVGALTPGDILNKIRNTDIWKEKQARKNERSIKGYSEKGSLNYPCLVSLSGDIDVLFSSGIFSRGWKEFAPQMSCSTN